MPPLISHLSQVVRRAQQDLGVADGDGAPAIALGLLAAGTVHFVTDPPHPTRWPLVRTAATTRAPVVEADVAVLPLELDDELVGVLLWEGDTAELGRLPHVLARHLVDELANARRHAHLEALLRDHAPAVALAEDEELAPALAAKGAMRDVTVLFADLRGFTSFTERTASEVVVSYLNQLFGPAIAVVQDHGGTIANLMGDAIMATFGADVVQPDHPYLGAQAGLALTTTFADAHPDLPRLGVGVNTGPAWIGDIGGASRKVSTLIGDTVNVAARLESTTQPGEVIIGPETYRTLRPIATVEAKEPLRLKGKEGTVQAYRLLALDDASLSRDTFELRA